MAPDTPAPVPPASQSEPSQTVQTVQLPQLQLTVANAPATELKSWKRWVVEGMVATCLVSILLATVSLHRDVGGLAEVTKRTAVDLEKVADKFDKGDERMHLIDVRLTRSEEKLLGLKLLLSRVPAPRAGKGQ